MNPTFTYVQTITNSFPLGDVAISSSHLFVTIDYPTLDLVNYYNYNGATFQFISSTPSNLQISPTPDLSFYTDGINTNTFSLYAYSNGFASLNFSYTFPTSTVSLQALNSDATLLACANSDQKLNLFYQRGCPN